MSKKKNKKEWTKEETIDEFLARGGKITVIPPKSEEPEDGVIIKPNYAGPPTLFSLDEAQHFFGKKKVVKKQVKKPDFSKIDKDKLPKALHYFLTGGKSDNKGI